MLFYPAHGFAFDKLIVKLDMAAVLFGMCDVIDKLLYDCSADLVAGLLDGGDTGSIDAAELNIVKAADRDVLADPIPFV